MDDANHNRKQERPSDASDECYRLLFQRAGVALIATDTDLNITAWNDAATRIFGSSAAQMMGTAVLNLVPAEERGRVERIWRRVVQNREVKEFQFTRRDDHGNLRHLAASVSPMVGADGVTWGISSCVTDITRFMERLHQADQGRKMTALGEMAGALAHHFNNILGGLVTSVDFALAARNPEIEHNTLEQTARSLARASRLMDHLLAFAEGDPRQEDLSDLTEVVFQATDLLEPELAEAKVKLELNINVLPVAPVPRQQLLTVLFNLTHNAVDAMPDGGTLRIDVEHRDDHCLLRFTDTGCGVKEEDLDRIFEPFYSTKSASLSPEERTTGFGLAVVHGIIQEIGGQISVASEVGKGTTVEVRIPCDGNCQG